MRQSISPVREFAATLAVISLSLTYTDAARGDDIHDTATAESLFEEGKTLFAKGQTSDACVKFASSYHMDPQIGTLLFLATCHEAEGRDATAWGEFNSALATLQHAHNARRETYAQQHLDVLSHKLSRLVLAVPAAITGVELKIDDQPIDPSAFGAPMPVDAGTHTISAAAPDRRPWSTTVEVAEGPVDVPVAVPVLEPLSPPPAPPEAPPATAPAPSETAEASAAPPAAASSPPAAPAALPSPAPATPSPGEEAKRPPNPNAAVAYVSGGIGLAGLALGGAAGALALVDKSEAESGPCEGKYCTPHGLDLYSRATTAAWVSTGACAAGAAGLAVAAAALLFGRRGSEAQARIRVLPALGGMQIAGAW